MGAQEHRSLAPAPGLVKIFIMTASDSRTPETNQGGRLVKELAQAAGFVIAGESLLPDDRDALRAAVAELCAREAADVILLTGDGYGELFRMLSFAEIGSAAMLSRAIAGTIGRVALFAMPGSPAGVRLAMERLILPELAHVVGELNRPGGPGPGHGPHAHTKGGHGQPQH